MNFWTIFLDILTVAGAFLAAFAVLAFIVALVFIVIGSVVNWLADNG